MQKKKVVEQVQAYLVEELAGLLEAAKAAHDAATHEEAKSEDKHDTRSIEAGYLAGAQAQRAADIQSLLTMYRFLPLREYTAEDVVCPAALVELELNGSKAFYFVAPQGGGLITNVDGKPVQVITPQSPIGEAILGRKVGDTFEVETRTQTREYKILSIQ
jgi:transcription elongation GreA/GreB family factor